jgi:hypothetical protein
VHEKIQQTYLLLIRTQRPPLLPDQPPTLDNRDVLEVAALLPVLGEEDVRSHGRFRLAFVVNLLVPGIGLAGLSREFPG